MDFANLLSILNPLVTNPYFVLFILMVLEGPIVTTAASFAASFGYFNIFLVFLLSVIGDLIGDMIYYELGRMVREPLIEKYSHKFGFKKENILDIEYMLHSNIKKSLVIIKFTPFIATMGLLLAGTLKIPRKKFISIITFITIPRAIFFTVIGYYFGVVINPLLKYYKATQYVFLIIGLIIIIAYLFYRWSSKKFVKAYTKRAK